MKQSQLRLLSLVKGRMTRIGLSVLFSLAACGLLQAQFLVPELVFMNPQLRTGAGYPKDGDDGAAYIFSNVGVGIDALITIQGRSSSKVILSGIDLKGPEQDPSKGTGFDNAWQPKVNYGNGSASAHSSWWMEFKISFVKHDDPNEPVSVNQFFVSGSDIDGDGDKLHEFLSFYRMQYFTLERNSMITSTSVKGCLNDPQPDGKRFDGPVKNDHGSVGGDADMMVSIFYRHTNSLVVRVGAETGSGSSSATDRVYALWFRSLAFDVPVSTALPLTLIAFNKQLKNIKDVNSNRTTGEKQDSEDFTLRCRPAESVLFKR